MVGVILKTENGFTCIVKLVFFMVKSSALAHNLGKKTCLKLESNYTKMD